MAKARDIPALDPGLSFQEAASLVLATRSAEVWEHEGRALDTGDLEGVHDMRVATRRLRAAMEIFAPVFPKKRHARALKEVKGLADTLGARRDPDVMVGHVRALQSSLSGEDEPGVDSLVAELRSDQETANAALAASLERVEEGRLRQRLELLAAEVRA